jgi:hypothetical protein
MLRASNCAIVEYPYAARSDRRLWFAFSGGK